MHAEALHLQDSKDKGIRPLAVTRTAWARSRGSRRARLWTAEVTS
ncbi:hypothetical protein [Streptomyces camelliae]|uniref:Uncharacterized protein n=1 Tax=Streptomyces camelliae TaxID=3004093 RepID=A0ABY7PI94_9ACTN|nr:hypothetical protein [Streptomyces sp. HUAS 2-6]WBO69422.1 hypothetical protein O1G22_32515 [Streptomyces sp. HUAS 2-6]